MKHAYLIIANRNHQQLQTLITMLDDSRNDIYLMIDKKSCNFNYNFHVDYSTLNYVPPISIYWGNYSQIEAELKLFSAASNEHYGYYHLLSGLDLPLDNQDNIHKFFDSHPNKEFLTYGNPDGLSNIDIRVKHHFFRNHYRSHNPFIKLYRILETNILKYCRENIIPKDKIGYASNWVSLDDKFVQLIVQSQAFIKNIFKYGYLVDELFIPTLINFHPQFINKIYYKYPMHDNPDEFQGNLRYINWWDGNPYVWELKDFDTLMKARNRGHLFSRKFDCKIDSKIIKKIFNNVMNS